MNRHTNKLLSHLVLIAFITVLSWSCSQEPDGPPRVLVFSKTAGFRHESIPNGIEAIRKIGLEKNFKVDTTENADRFNEENLKKYRAVIFLNTTGDVLNKQQQNDFERFIQAGGGYVGVHAAADTEYNWPWYGGLAGGYFNGHPNNPNVRTATFNVIDKSHPASAELPDSFEKTDEFYNYKNIQEDLTVLTTIDESSYEGGTNGEFHPMMWYHEYDGGRAFYTAMGHTEESYTEDIFLKSLTGGILYALGGENSGSLDYSRATSNRVPDENRFSKVVLAEKLNEPMELAVMNDGRVLFIERLGKVRLYDPEERTIKEVGTIDVSHKYNFQDGNQPEAEDGLLGLALDPNFESNHWIYLYYSPAGNDPKNILARYEFRNEEVKSDTRKVILEVPVQRDYCCHTGGSITFDENGNLFLSTGDNSSPRATPYAPLDERPGREAYDSRRGASNTNDLRGKILRIHPEPDGTYTIPEGNLFPPGTEKTKPEIYVMGTRNPFRISYDKHTGFLYWGDVGPDSRADSAGIGPESYDEINQARKPGYYGWPLFVGNSSAYYDYDFETNTSGPKFDPSKPINDSRNNTGLVELPPLEPGFIWYPYGVSEEFPLMGTGGRTAMAGPVYYSDDFAGASRAFPDYYDGKLFIYEWVRGWIMAVTMDEEGNYVDMERFMPGHRFSNPMDMDFGPDGDLYVLEYGQGWFVQNDDARLVKIEYNGGNRVPQIRIAADKTRGAVPLTVTFDSKGTTDFDRDEITYDWKLVGPTGSEVAKSDEANPTFIIDSPGIYNTRLTVTDSKGESAIQDVELIAGNEPPAISFNLEGNRTFYFANTPVKYNVKVEDREDGSLNAGISENEVAVTIDYLEEGYDQVHIAQGHVLADESVAAVGGKKLMDESDCATCHKVDSKSIGPDFKSVAAKYESESGSLDYLAAKIINGGSGAWGEVAMAPHPGFSADDARNIVRYIFSLNDEDEQEVLQPTAGEYIPEIKTNAPSEAVIIMRASYTDHGSEDIPPAVSRKMLVLRNPMVIPGEADEMEGVEVFNFNDQSIAIPQESGAYTMFSQLDLTGINAVRCMATVPVEFVNATGGVIEVRLDAPDGKLIGKSEFLAPVEGSPQQMPPKVTTFDIEKTTGMHDVYFVYNSEGQSANVLVHLTAEFLP